MGELGEAARLKGSRPFVGRDREMAELAAALEDAVGGRGRLLLLAGEPGIGKTWLAELVAEGALQRGIWVLWGRCWDGGGAPPFWPWAQIITTFAEGSDDQTLARHLGACASSVAQVAPGVADRIGRRFRLVARPSPMRRVSTCSRQSPNCSRRPHRRDRCC
jgi:hypothetical protein